MCHICDKYTKPAAPKDDYVEVDLKDFIGKKFRRVDTYEMYTVVGPFYLSDKMYGLENDSGAVCTSHIKSKYNYYNKTLLVRYLTRGEYLFSLVE